MSGDPEVAHALQEKAGKYLSKLFRPVTTLPENRGLDCNLGIDFDLCSRILAA